MNRYLCSAITTSRVTAQAVGVSRMPWSYSLLRSASGSLMSRGATGGYTGHGQDRRYGDHHHHRESLPHALSRPSDMVPMASNVDEDGYLQQYHNISGSKRSAALTKATAASNNTIFQTFINYNNDNNSNNNKRLEQVTPRSFSSPTYANSYLPPSSFVSSPSPHVSSTGMVMRPHRRICYTNRMHPLIHKRRTITRSLSLSNSRNAQKRHLASSSSSSADRVTWREAATSPRKALRYVVQMTYDLIDWAKHMWTGAKLLAADVRVSTKILKRMTQGKQLTRRERNFIVQTGVDLARLVPFSLFLIIPLAEFALPLALRFFPNMLPSQFQDQMRTEENLKKRLKARLELAKYLREVVEEKAKVVQSSDANSELKKTAKHLTEFLHAIQSGHDVSADEISRFAKFFNDELTIDGAARPQLVAMCKYMGISPYGHDVILRFKLRSRLNAIKTDDMQIMWEGGVGSLTDSEVAKACRDRGIREELSNTFMRRELNEWLELAQKREIPGSLMIMSRAFKYGRAEPVESGDELADDEEETQNIRETLGSMPEDVIMDVKKAADRTDVNIARLEETLRQAKLIELESDRIERKEKEDEEKRKKREEDEEGEEQAQAQDGDTPAQAGKDGAAVGDVQLSSPNEGVSATGAVEAGSAAGTGTTKADAKPFVVSTTSAESSSTETISDSEVLGKVEALEATIRKEVMEKEKDVADEAEEELKKSERIRGMLVSLGQLSCDSSVEAEREELRNLKRQLAEAELPDKNNEKGVGIEMRGFKTLVRRLEREIERVDAKVGLRMKLLDQDNDGVMSLDEVRHAMTALLERGDDDEGENERIVESTLQRLDQDADGNISKADLTRLLNEMQFEYGLVDDAGESKSKDS